MPQAMKIPQAKAAMDKEWKNVWGVNSARGQDSSIGGRTGNVCLGAVLMEEEVQDRVQAEVGEAQNKRSTAHHGWPWRWGDAHKHILEPSGVTHVRHAHRAGEKWRVRCSCLQKQLGRFQHGSWEKSRGRRRLFRRHKKTNRKSTLPHWWTDVIFRMQRWNPYFQKYKGRVVLRGDIVKNDSFSVWWARLICVPDDGRNSNGSRRKTTSAGQVADAVSASTRVKLEDATRLLKIPNSECPDIWIRLPQHNWRKRLRELQETTTKGITESNRKTKLACIGEAPESLRKRMVSNLPRNHEEHIAARGFNSMKHFNLVHKFIPMPQAMKIPDSTAAFDKEWEKLENLPAWKQDEVKSKKDVILEAKKKEKKKVHLITFMDICHLENAELEPQIQRTSRTPRRHRWKTTRVHMQHLQNKDRLLRKWRLQHWWMSVQGHLIVQDKPPTQYLLAPKWKWRTLQGCWRFQSQNVQICIWVRLPPHKWQKSRSDIDDPAVPLERNLYG